MKSEISGPDRSEKKAVWGCGRHTTVASSRILGAWRKQVRLRQAGALMERGTAASARFAAVRAGRCGSGGNGPTVMQGRRRIGPQQRLGPHPEQRTRLPREEESTRAVRGRDESGRPD